MPDIASHSLPTAADLAAPVAGNALWSVERAASPLIGTAIHNGHALRDEVAAVMGLDAAGRLREEDPFTAYAISDVPNRIVFHRSRFEIDLNRGAEGAVYLRPDQAWGLDVWAKRPADDLVRRSLDVHAAYYAMLGQTLTAIAAEHGRFVLLDIHSYNHRRAGPDAGPTPEAEAPQINIGTISMDRARWAHVVDPFMDSLRGFSFRGRPMDVRENIAFEGRGEQTRFVHANFPDSGCAIAIEFKKFFMDEWTGAPDPEALAAMRAMLAASLPVLLDSLRAST
ncbi:N-formylglutamate amidohydrolase [Devosia sp. Root635]|uniref:N-formylglutamate amidohydrolase n=1 Tax=Devosia sp. Root635 TaxID=1736575 RepID=UPI0006F547C8|nr:N-formylglutamate amidohydrolase [Devosia sp. Root635]KRA50687.1 N-formylglutamate amidohydrolase [Devosia sp. Root635]